MIENKHHILPKGTYYIGDPLSILKSLGEEVINGVAPPYDKNFNLIVGIINEVEICFGCTGFGDGRYKDQYDNIYYVNSGQLGIINTSLLSSVVDSEHIHKHKFDDDFAVSRDLYGLFKFGDLVINTGDKEGDISLWKHLYEKKCEHEKECNESIKESGDMFSDDVYEFMLKPVLEAKKNLEELLNSDDYIPVYYLKDRIA